jgi:hypothetical protein
MNHDYALYLALMVWRARYARRLARRGLDLHTVYGAMRARHALVILP